MVTQKSQRRARVKLLAQAEAESKEKKITLADAVLAIIERGEDHELVLKAFAGLDDTSSQAASEKAEMEAYLDAPY